MKTTSYRALGIVVIGSAFGAGACASAASDPALGEERGATVSEALSVTATYDATLKVPRCGSVSSSCDSGTLTRGRASRGPEANAPNTLRGSCADGTAGVFHSDESVDSLRISTADGTDIAPGKRVNVAATVWAYAGFSSDHLDLYYTADATSQSPVWSLITTLSPQGAGTQTLTGSYTVPSGGAVQAVRAGFRYGGAPAPCTSGAYDDRDDLAFAVAGSAPPPPDTTAPTTSLAAPSSGATVSGTVTLSASATDNVGVTKVEFYANSLLVGTSLAAPFAATWDTTTVANGAYVVQTKAYDAAGNVGSGAPVTVNVSQPVLGPNLIVNGGLEGTPAPWSFANSATFVASGSPTHSGTGHAYLHPMLGHGMTSFSQNVTVPAAGATLTFWMSCVRTGPQSGAQDSFQVDVRPLDGSASSGYGYGTPPASGYQQKTIDLKAFAGKAVTIAFDAVSSSDWSGFDPTWGVFFHVDDVKLQ